MLVLRDGGGRQDLVGGMGILVGAVTGRWEEGRVCNAMVTL